jgi:hypothetical protein
LRRQSSGIEVRRGLAVGLWCWFCMHRVAEVD